MDPETSSAIESLRQDIGQRITAVEHDVRGDMRGLRGEIGELRGEIREIRGDIVQIRGEIGGLRGELGGLRDELHEETRTIRAEMQEMREELMRHAMVLTDSVRDDIRIVADGLAAVSAKLDTLRR